MSDRIIISESDRAGLAISAPALDKSQPYWYTNGTMRWIQREESFSLQQFRQDHWEDVPVVKEGK